MGIGIAFTARHVALCRARRRRRRIEVARAVTVPLPAGALTPAFGAPNVTDPAACEAALAAALDQARIRDALVAVALPDPAVRVRLLPAAPQGRTRRERARLVAWELRESLPCPPAEARVDYRPLAREGPVLCLAAAAAVVAEYEGLLGRRRLVPVQIGAASLALWPLLERAAGPWRPHGPAAPALGVLLVEEGYVTLLASAAGVLRFWRCLLARGAGPAALAREVGDCLHALTGDGTLPGPPRLLAHSASAGGAGVLEAVRREADFVVGDVAWPAGVPDDPALLPALGAALSV